MQNLRGTLPRNSGNPGKAGRAFLLARLVEGVGSNLDPDWTQPLAFTPRGFSLFFHDQPTILFFNRVG